MLVIKFAWCEYGNAYEFPFSEMKIANCTPLVLMMLLSVTDNDILHVSPSCFSNALLSWLIKQFCV